MKLRIVLPDFSWFKKRFNQLLESKKLPVIGGISWLKGNSLNKNLIHFLGTIILGTTALFIYFKLVPVFSSLGTNTGTFSQAIFPLISLIPIMIVASILISLLR